MESGRKSHVMVICVLIVGAISQTFAQTNNTAVHFDHDSDVLKKSETDILDSLYQRVKDYRLATLSLDGYCDSTGNFQYNLGLSERRATSVLNYFTNHGLQISCTYFEGHSFNDPIASNLSSEGRYENRRVRIEIQPTKSNNSGTLIGHVKGINQEKIASKIHIFDLTDTTKKPINIITTRGDYKVPLDKQHDYLIIATAKGYFPDFQTLHVVSRHEITAILKPLKKQHTYLIPNMGFVPSEATLLPESLPTLEGLLQLMRDNPEIKIKLEGHTNSVRSKHEEDWHIDLSNRRANSIATYLINNEVESNRVSAEGLGSKFMIHSDPSSTRSQLKKNRRVEVRIQ